MDSATAERLLRRRYLGIRWPLLLQAPATPLSSRPIAFDSTTTATRFTWRVIFSARAYTIPGGLLLVISQVAGALMPAIAGAAINRAVATHSPPLLAGWLAVLAVDVLVFSLGYRFGSRMGFYGMQAVQHRLRTQVTDRLLDPRGMRKPPLHGALLSIATGDVFRLAATMRIGIYPLGDLAAVLVCAIALLVINRPLGVAVLVAAPVMLVLMTVAGRPLQRRSQAQQATVAAATGYAGDLIAGYRVLKGLDAGSEAALRYRDVSRQALTAALRARNSRGLYQGAMNVITGLFVAGLTVAAAGLALHGSMSVGQLIAAVGLIQFLIGPLTGLPLQIGAILAVGVASGKRVLDVLNMPFAHADRTGAARDARAAGDAGRPAGRDDAGQGDAGQGDAGQGDAGQWDAGRAIAREGGAGRLTVNSIEICAGATGIRAPAGSILGISGPAADQRRLLQALADGSGVSLDGLDASALPIDEYRALVLVAPHAADLFDGSLTENLDTPGARAGRTSPQLAAAGTRALHAACCDDIVAALPRGAESPVGESGTRLSGGQRQRVALARAYAASPPVLVLHDPTTAVDSVTESAIADRLPDIRAGAITLVVTNSPTMLAACHRVVETGLEAPA